MLIFYTVLLYVSRFVVLEMSPSYHDGNIRCLNHWYKFNSRVTGKSVFGKDELRLLALRFEFLVFGFNEGEGVADQLQGEVVGHVVDADAYPVFRIEVDGAHDAIIMFFQLNDAVGLTFDGDGFEIVDVNI